MSEQIIGKIEEIQETKTYPKKDGTGNLNVTKIKIAGKYFTCFYSKEDIEKLNVGQSVDVTYTEKENEYQGKKFINYNISTIQPTDKNIGNVSGSGTIKIGDKSYKIILEEI
jgi:hypothetical protein